LIDLKRQLGVRLLSNRILIESAALRPGVLVLGAAAASASWSARWRCSFAAPISTFRSIADFVGLAVRHF
jgi:hypothetical protein